MRRELGDNIFQDIAQCFVVAMYGLCWVADAAVDLVFIAAIRGTSFVRSKFDGK